MGRGEAILQIFQTPHIPVLLPRGDIHVEVGSPQFTISCHLNPENKYYRDGHRSDRLGIYATDERNNQRQLNKTRRATNKIETKKVSRYRLLFCNQ